MKIELPEGFQLPATAKPGQPFEVVATLMMGEDGVMLQALDGVEIPEMEDDGEGETEVEVEVKTPEYADPEVQIPFEQ